MKLIIEISKSYFEEIKNGIGWNNFRPYHLIANSIQLDDVLQEIRQKIVNLVKTYPFIDHKDTYVKEDEVLEIIDKYLDKSK